MNLAVFSLFFPLFQIMSTSSIPQPLDPKLPTSSLTISFLPQAGGSFSMAAAEGGEEARGRRGNPLVPLRIRVLWGADKVYTFLVANFASKKKDASATSSSSGYGGGAGAYGADANGGGWRGDFMGAVNKDRGSGGQQAGAAAAYGGYGHSGSGFVQSPPRRGHVQTESSVGVDVSAHGGEFADRRLDSLISAAGRRKKGE